MPVPPRALAVLEANGYRFGMAVATYGFTRRDGNYGGQIAKGLGIGILSLGLYVPVPVKASSGVACAIIDAETGKTIFYKKSFQSEIEPLDIRYVSKHIDKIFGGYFYKKPEYNGY